MFYACVVWKCNENFSVWFLHGWRITEQRWIRSSTYELYHLLLLSSSVKMINLNLFWEDLLATQSSKYMVCRKKKSPKIFNVGRDLFAVVLKFLCILTAQLFSFHFFLVFSFFLFLLLFLVLLFGILFSFQSPYHCFLILTVARVRGSRLFTLLWTT